MACGTALDILAHKLDKAQPPEFGGDELVSLKISWVTSGFMVVAVGEDGATEGVLQGNVDMTFVGEDVVIELPVREL